jgi:acyl-CoA synthetase (AMP-forming)/AMP-acid ligase II
VSADELRDHCRTLLARYKCPSQIVFLDELPKGLGGKVLRRLLR